jgi:hypothetical protein
LFTHGIAHGVKVLLRRWVLLRQSSTVAHAEFVQGKLFFL